jgi:hypothetical protein
VVEDNELCVSRVCLFLFYKIHYFIPYAFGHVIPSRAHSYVLVMLCP